MANVIVQERFAWFHNKVRSGRYPNSRQLAEHFEVSHRTAKRDIAFMRDRILAPLVYDPSQKGYCYTDATFEFPEIPVTQEEILFMLIARRLLTHAADGLISKAIRKFGRRLLSGAESFGLSESCLNEAFSASWHGFSPVTGDLFREVAAALIQHRLLEIDYRSPLATGPTCRIVEPHHLQHYMASWVLVAWCRQRSEWRKFYLSRMTELKILDAHFERRPRDDWYSLVEGSFGIFQGESRIAVTLRFNPFRARWVRDQLWHSEQTLEALPDGGLDLTFPVSDFREVKMLILQFGADVEVVAPEALRREVASEITRMAARYSAENDIHPK